MRNLAALVGFAVWITGIVFAAGFWQTFFTIIFPPYSWYVAIENALRIAGWI